MNRKSNEKKFHHAILIIQHLSLRPWWALEPVQNVTQCWRMTLRHWPWVEASSPQEHPSLMGHSTPLEGPVSSVTGMESKSEASL